ncbi:MAG TPA: membrane protein insertion efficiency factor YidD, partial [Thermodesulfobacteriota bacterium]|nr:membrane protein insertion efficiency factor YidD [Thermodesulfobacteriota bacterium]
LIWTVAILLPVSSNAQYMRAPGEVGQQVLPAETVETSPVKIGLAGLVWIYRNGVSPVSPDRCGFMPSCSAYSALAVREHGPFWGVIMSADRLMRCHYLKKPGPFTPLLPNGKILDLPPNTPFPEFF